VGLRRIGYESFMFVADRSGKDPFVQRFAPPRTALARLRRRLRRWRISPGLARYETSRPLNAESFSDDRNQHGTDPIVQFPPCDVLNLHWATNFIDHGALFAAAAARRLPVVWTLHDMNAFTGGCHFDGGCGKFVRSCGACPQLGSAEERDLSRQIWERKRAAFADPAPGRLQVVAASRWLAAEARRSALLGDFPVTTIHYGLDLEAFAPRDRCLARSVLGIPRDASVVLFVAALMAYRRKGFALLSEALAGLAGTPGLFLLSLGEGDGPAPGSVSRLHLDYVKNDRLLSLIYSAADVFVIPSLQENLAQTALEATACGVPTVGFAVGGITDMVRDGVTGLLVPPGDVEALRAAIVRLLKDPARRSEMSANARRLAVEEFSLDLQARRYAELYDAILQKSCPPSAKRAFAALA
jgi:glycosyltransferase involved in cell wall biosynthesis